MEVDYFCSLVSPWTYMGHQRLMAIAARHGATVNFKPTNLGQVFPVSGGLPLAKRAPQRQAYRMMELKRWREHLGVALTLEPRFFPVNETAARHAVVAVMESGGDPEPLIFAVLRAVWSEEKDISDPPTLRTVVEGAGLDADAVLAAAQSPEVAARAEALTQEAVDAGVFGAPTYRVGSELFWGQDRLEFVERALSRAAG